MQWLYGTPLVLTTVSFCYPKRGRLVPLRLSTRFVLLDPLHSLGGLILKRIASGYFHLAVSLVKEPQSPVIIIIGLAWVARAFRQSRHAVSSVCWTKSEAVCARSGELYSQVFTTTPVTSSREQD